MWRKWRPATVLEVQAENVVSYVGEVSDVSKFATEPGVTSVSPMFAVRIPDRRNPETVDVSDSKEGTVANENKTNRRSWNHWAELLVMSCRELPDQKTLILDKST